MDNSRQENVEARAAAEAYVERGEETCRANRLDPRKFWVVVAVMATDRAGLTKQADEMEAKWRKRVCDTMSEDEAESFGKKRIEFGKHSGKLYKDVPTEYLEWLDGKYVESIDAHRYFESRKFHREQSDG